MINGMELKRIVEVGVYTGAATREILENCPGIEEYWAVDPWIKYEGEGAGSLARVMQGRWDALAEEVFALEKVYPALHVLRLTSVQAAEELGNKEFDLVFIDAVHKYDSVVEDIRAWYPLVRVGGVIGGHDYYSRRFPGVTHGVNESFSSGVLRLLSTIWVKMKT